MESVEKIIPIPWQANMEWFRMEQFIYIIDSVHHSSDFNTLRNHAQSIRFHYESLIDPMVSLCSATCGACKDICCMRATIWYDFKDLLYLYFAFGELPEQQIHKLEGGAQSERHCCHFTPTGCKLSRLERPFVCTWYICPDQKSLLHSDVEKETVAVDIQNNLNEIKRLRKQMNTLFCDISGVSDSRLMRLPENPKNNHK